MALSDPVTTTREDVISLVACRDDYGHTNQIIDLWFWQLLEERLTDEEIAAYGEGVAALDGYSDEDREEIVERLTDWRDRWVERTTPTPPTPRDPG